LILNVCVGLRGY